MTLPNRDTFLAQLAASPLSDLPHEGKRCGICVEPLSDDCCSETSNKTAPCRRPLALHSSTHVYCAPCVYNWTRTHNDCPMCRTQLYRGLFEHEELLLDLEKLYRGVAHAPKPWDDAQFVGLLRRLRTAVCREEGEDAQVGFRDEGKFQWRIAVTLTGKKMLTGGRCKSHSHTLGFIQNSLKQC
jgi:hypothetical protein